MLCFIPKLEKCSVAVDEPGRVGERDAEVEGLDELEICMAEFENVDLDNDWTRFIDNRMEIHLQDICEID